MPSLVDALRLALDPGLILQAQGLTPDPWQRQFLLCEDRAVMLLCCRGAGKSRATSAKALHTALTRHHSLTLLVSRSQRQSRELFRYVKQGYAALGRPVRALKQTQSELELENGSRVVCLPGREDTIRSFQGVTLLIKDEAARIPDDLNKAVTPMLAVSRGQEIDLSTPFGQRGWFWRKWHDDARTIRRFKVSWRDCPRHSEEFIRKEIAEHGTSWVRQEYECSFESLSGLVYPDFATAVTTDVPPPAGRAVGGLDFGFRNPFAAVWGTYDPDADRLTLTGERYLRETPLHQHAAELPRDVLWYADPAHPTEIAALRHAGFTVKRAANDIAAGIAVVRTLAETGRLTVLRGRCPNLLAEARLYRYADAADGRSPSEVPVDEHNHALAALRYLCGRLFPRLLDRARGRRNPDPTAASVIPIEPGVDLILNPFTPPRRPPARPPAWLDPAHAHQWLPFP